MLTSSARADAAHRRAGLRGGQLWAVQRCAAPPLPCSLSPQPTNSPLVRALRVAMMPALATLIVCCSITSCSCRGQRKRGSQGRQAGDAVSARVGMLAHWEVGRHLSPPMAGRQLCWLDSPCCVPHRSSCRTRRCSTHPAEKRGRENPGGACLSRRAAPLNSPCC
jgi:hypothetical protein